MLRVLEILKDKEKKNAKLSWKYKGLKDWSWADSTYFWTLLARGELKGWNAIVWKTKWPLCSQDTFQKLLSSSTAARTPPMEDNNSTKHNPITSWTFKLHVAVNRSIDSVVRVTMQFLLYRSTKGQRSLSWAKMDNAQFFLIVQWYREKSPCFFPQHTHMHTHRPTYPQALITDSALFSPHLF